MTRPFFVAALVAVSSSSLAAEPIEVTVEEFKMVKHYQHALEDPRVQKLKPEARLAAVAKDAGYKPKELQKALERVEAAGDLKARCEASIREALAGGALKDRVAKVEVDTTEPHAVGYVQWLNEKPEALTQEASVAAAQASAACPILSTLTVWAQDKANPKARVWQGIISSSAAQKINLAKVADFAETRYVRLFEKVKSVVAGDDLTTEPAASTAGK
jgi:hypothetical protein